MDGICCDSAAIEIRTMRFFALTGVTPIQRAFNCIQPYLNGLNQCLMQCLTTGQ